MIGIVAAHDYFQPLFDNEPLPPLAPLLQAVCDANIRRIDRFIQLALLGSASCARDRALRPDCAIYLGSGHGPIGNNVVTQQQLIRNARTPKPVNFINTLGTSAGFHVARNLNIHGQNHFLSRLGGSFEAALTAAVADMTLGVVKQALVGVVEEVVTPLPEHRQRQRLPQNLPIAEGSHWLLLDTDATSGGAVHLRRHDNPKAHNNDLRGGLAVSSMATDAIIAVVQSGLVSAFHDSLTGARVIAAIAQGTAVSLRSDAWGHHGALFYFTP